HLESYLRELRGHEARLTAAGLDALVAGVDALERTIAARRDGHAPPVVEAIVGSLEAVMPTAVAASATEDAAAPQAAWRVTFAPAAELLARGINVDVVRARLRQAGRIVSAAPKIRGGS